MLLFLYVFQCKKGLRGILPHKRKKHTQDIVLFGECLNTLSLKAIVVKID